MLPLLVSASLAQAADGGAGLGTPNPIVQLQLWGTAYDQDTDPQADAATIGDPEDDAGLKIKRVRLGFQDKNDELSYRVTAGFSAPYDGLEQDEADLQIIDAVMGYRFTQNFAMQAGKSQVPFSRDLLMSSTDLTFEERGFGAEYIAPDRSLGASLVGMGDGFRAQAGVYNSGGTVFGDDNDGKTFAGRVEYDVGDRDTYAFHGGTERGFTLGFGGSSFYTLDVSTNTLAAGGDVLMRYRGVALLVDGAWSKISPVNSDIAVPGVLADTTRMALTTQLSYSIKDWELAARFTGMDDSSLGKYGQILGGVVFHALHDKRDLDRLRVGAGYVHRLEPEGLKNNSVRLWTQVRI